MKITKIILSIITMLFAVLGLVKILPFDIANPIMLVSLRMHNNVITKLLFF